jgi:hypothetical protein
VATVHQRGSDGGALLAWEYDDAELRAEHFLTVAAGLSVRYTVGDTHYSADWFTKRLAQLGLIWNGTLDPKTNLVWLGRKQPVRDLVPQLHLQWRHLLRLRARALRVYAPKYVETPPASL